MLNTYKRSMFHGMTDAIQIHFNNYMDCFPDSSKRWRFEIPHLNCIFCLIQKIQSVLRLFFRTLNTQKSEIRNKW